jgi:hypothetical protein
VRTTPELNPTRSCRTSTIRQTSAEQPLSLDVPDAVRRLRDVLDRAGYTESGAQEVLRSTEAPLLGVRTSARQDLPLLIYRSRGEEPLHTLLRLFLLGVPVGLDAARRAAEPMSLEEWSALGLVQIQGNAVAGTVDLFPYQNLLIVSDSPWQADPPANQVLSVSNAAQLLAHLALWPTGGQALDVGTGCGLLAYLAAPHSDRVVATDCNPRALNLAQFGAQLNGLANVEFREGDLFAPAGEQTFDLVVMNPPFVISPVKGPVWRDGGMRGDWFCRRVVREVPARLREGGFCQLACNWVHTAGEDWRAALAGWFEGTGCDVWVLHIRTFDPASYAASWLEPRPGETPEARARRFAERMQYYEQERIEAIGYGVIVMRRTGGRPNWWYCDAAPEPTGPCGAAVRLRFALRDFLEATRDDAVLLAARVRLAPDLRWEQQLAPTADGWTATAASIRLAEGLPYTGVLDAPVAALLQLCRGERGLGDLLNDLAASQGWEVDKVRPAFVHVVRRLLEQAFLLPAAGPASRGG